MLQNTGSRIKQFIAHRKSKHDEDDRAHEYEKPTKRHSKTQSWMSRAPTPTELIFRKPKSNINSRKSSLAQSIPKTIHSSASSLCSCCEPNTVSPPHSSSSNAPGSPKILCLNLCDSGQIFGDSVKWTRIFPDSHSPSYLVSQFRETPKFGNITTMTEPTLDFMEALSIEPIHDTIPQADLQNMPSTERLVWSPSLHELIRGTDDAFQAGGLALQDAKPIVQEWFTDDIFKTTKTAQPRSVLRKKNQASLSRKASISKKKKKQKGDKDRERPQDLRGFTTRSDSPERQKDGHRPFQKAKDIKARTFIRSLANPPNFDENRLSSRVQRLQIEDSSMIGLKVSSETTRSGLSDGGVTPVEPFHLDDLPSRLGAAGVLPSPTLSHEADLATKELLKPPIPAKSILRRTSSRPAGSKDSHPKKADLQSRRSSLLQYRDTTFPKPPQASQLQVQPYLRSKLLSLNLTTIPEVSPLNENPAIWRKAQPPEKHNYYSTSTSILTSTFNAYGPKIYPGSTQVKQSQVEEQQNSSVSNKLESTPYSMTSPTFRHGSIRLNVPKGPPPKRRRICKVDDGMVMDLTAFQMAISGGAGDFLMGGVDMSNWLDEMKKDIDELEAWWSGLGFGSDLTGIGSLVREDTETREEYKRSLNLEIAQGQDMKESHIHAARFDGKTQGTEAEIDFPERVPEVQNSTFIQMPITGPTERPASGYESDYSLPESPMDTIRQDALDKLEPVVLMGFNLGHDLDEFLRWEAEHVDFFATLGDYD